MTACRKSKILPQRLVHISEKKTGIPGAARLSCVFSYRCLRSINVWPQSTPLILLYKPRLEVMPFLSSKSTHLQILMLLVWQSAQSFSHLAVSVLQDCQSQPKQTWGRRAPEQGTEACDGLLCLTSTHTMQSNPLHLDHPAGPGSIPHLSSNLIEIFPCQALCSEPEIFHPISFSSQPQDGGVTTYCRWGNGCLEDFFGFYPKA